MRKKRQHGGARLNSGRPPKEDKESWGRITCTLRIDTIAKLHEGAGSRFFGEFLQRHLDRFPPPDHATYQALLTRQPIVIKIKGRRSPVVLSAGATNRVKRVPKPPSKRAAEFLRAYNKAYEEVPG